jgi:flagellar assembly protein FliH
MVQGVIKKQTEFVSIEGVIPQNSMKKPAALEKRSIDNGEFAAKREAAISEQELEKQRIQKERDAEYERIRAEFMKQCEQALGEARDEAQDIVMQARREAQEIKTAAGQECEELRKTACEEGQREGYAAGEKPGYDDGFAKGCAECAGSIEEVGKILSRIPLEKEKIFKEYENQLFDLIFTISNKITAGSLNQKDKSVISKMLKEAAKEFRTSSYIKVSLSKLDIEESVNVDIEDLKRILGDSLEKRHIEFEVLKDAAKGTLILDNGSEITDASISTQLKMIQNLGQGKFKHKPDETIDS